MIQITPSLSIDENELQFDFIRSSGPGGQNVNKVSTAVQLRFNIIRSPSLSPEVKQRLARLAGKRVTEAGDLVIEAHTYRTQEQNKADALRRLAHWLERALVEPKPRKATRPSGLGRTREKSHRSEIKQARRFKPDDWDA